jgi:hypothetical protein
MFCLGVGAWFTITHKEERTRAQLSLCHTGHKCIAEDIVDGAISEWLVVVERVQTLLVIG